MNKLTREQAFEVAKKNYAAHQKADIANLFHNGPAFDAFAKFGYRNGWYHVGEFCFSQAEITGEAYDFTQCGLAYL